MKKALRYLLLLFPFCSYGQNYQCLQAGVKHYFTNGNGYLRGIRIDSVRTLGDTTVYYPFHTPRGTYNTFIGGSHFLDSSGGSWLGKRVLQKSDGTCLFDNLWHDSVIIKTQANVGDSWVFYKDSSVRYYMASVITIDTMTVSGLPDSIKTINLTVYDDTGYVPTDHLNNFKIVLSKNNGFVQVFDLYTFPYHKPGYLGPLYYNGYDYFLDHIIFVTGGPLYPTTNNSVFKLTPFINPTFEQLYDWNIGDVFENSTCTPGVNSTGMYPYRFYVDTITNKTVLPGSVQYDFKGWVATQVIWPPWITGLDLIYPYAFLPDSGYFAVSNNLLLDTLLMPEEYMQPLFRDYLPNDSSHCLVSGLYTFGPTCFSHDTLNVPMEGGGPLIIYKTGIGLVRYFQGAPELAEPLLTDTTLLYYYKGGISCGTYTVPSPIFTSVEDLKMHNSISIFPNPATEELTIKTTATTPYTITLQNMLGQTLQTTRTTKQEQTLNVTNLPAGVYNVSITDENGGRYNERVVIIH